MLAAGTIASLSFASLAAFGLPTIKNFGLCTAFGIVAALTVEMTFIPAIRVLMSPPSAGADRPREARGVLRPDPGEAGAHRPRRQGAADPVGVRRRSSCWRWSALARLKAGNTLGAQFFERNAPVHGFRMADARLAGTRVIQVLVEGDAPDTIKNPEVLRRMDELGVVHRPPAAARRQGRVDRRPAQADEPGHRPRAAAASCPTRPRASRSTCCSTRWAARRRTSPTSSITTSSAR